MGVLWRLIQTELSPYARSIALRVLIAILVSSAPYAFSFLGKWLVDDALQVTGPPKVEQSQSSESSQQQPGAGMPVTIEWKAKTASEKLRLLIIFLVTGIGIHVVVTAMSFLSEQLNSRMVQHLVFRLRTSLHEKVGQLDVARFGRERVGELMTRVLDDAGLIPANLMNLVVNSCTQVAMVGVGLFLLLKLNPSMTWTALIALPVYAVVCLAFLPRIQRNAEELRVRVAGLNGFIIERLTSILTVKNYAQEERDSGRFGHIVDGNIELSRAQQTLSLVFNTLTTLITGVTTLAVLAFGFINIRSGNMQLGEVLAFYQVTAQLFVPISALVGMTTVAATQRVLASRLYTILDAESTIQDPDTPIAVPDLKGDISFENVSLRYEEGGPFALEEVSLTIPAGSVTCIVGPTGSGKTTLLTLLSRMYDPTGGAIRLDGVDIRDMRLSDLRRAVGAVPRESQVFSGTIAENVAYGAPDATRKDIEAAARRVFLHDFIEGLPDGYDTRIGHGGEVLSATELTKLALARALVTGPAVLTIDDTYAVLDQKSERALRQAVREALSGRTILIATSRLAMCQDADLVIVMRHGRIHQMGTHGELLSAPGTYRRMYMREMGMEALPDASAQRGSA